MKLKIAKGAIMGVRVESKGVMKSYNSGVLLVVLGALFWASSGVMAESLFKKAYSVEWVNFYRLLFSGLFLVLLSFAPKKMWLFISPKELLSLLLFNVFGLLLAQFAYFKAISYIDAGTATRFGILHRYLLCYFYA